MKQTVFRSALHWQALNDHWWLLTLKLPTMANCLHPGQSLQLVTEQDCIMLPVMRCQPGQGTISMLSGSSPSDMAETVDISGPFGEALSLPVTANCLLLGQDSGMATALMLAADWRQQKASGKLQVLLGTTTRFPFSPRPSQMLWYGLPPGVIAAAPLLEDWQISSRLAGMDAPGCAEENVVELAEKWLATLTDTKPEQIIFSGPESWHSSVQHRFTGYQVICHCVPTVGDRKQ